MFLIIDPKSWEYKGLLNRLTKDNNNMMVTIVNSIEKADINQFTYVFDFTDNSYYKPSFMDEKINSFRVIKYLNDLLNFLKETGDLDFRLFYWDYSSVYKTIMYRRGGENNTRLRKFIIANGIGEDPWDTSMMKG